MEMKKVRWQSPEEMKKMLTAFAGVLIYALGLNLFLVPAGLYSGGVMGFCQVLRTLLVNYLHLPLAGFDISGIIYYLVNIPLFIMAFRSIGKYFFAKTLICVSAVTLCMSLIPIPSAPILTDDILGCSLIGGLITGFGTGLVLKMGSSQGGLDIVGLYMIKKKGNASIGKISLSANVVLYGICLFLFDVPTAIYSVIYAAVSSFVVDKIHSQNINMEVLIITKTGEKEMEADIFKELGRGVTQWNAQGAYTKEDTSILLVVLSKYEVPHLKRIVHRHNQEAFVIVQEGASIDGNYMKKLSS